MASGTITLSSSKAWEGYISWSSTQNVSANTSTVTATVYAYKDDGYTTSGSGSFSGTISIGSSSTTFSYSQETTSVTSHKTYSVAVSHGSDGVGSCTISATIKGPSGTSLSGYTLSGSGTVSLGTIIRTSSITSTAQTTLGNNCSIKWTPQSTSLAYKLKFSLGSWSTTTGYITPNQTSAYTYTGTQIPLEVANQLPSATSGTMSVTLYTYPSSSSSSYTGTDSATFTVLVPNSVVPTVSSASATIVNTNSVVSGWGVALAGYSKVQITASGSGSYSSTISSWKYSGSDSLSGSYTGTSLSTTTAVLSNSGTKQYSVTCTDSRGRTSTAVSTSSITFLAYAIPSITSFAVERSSDNYPVVSSAVWTYTSVNGKNAATAKLYYRVHNASSWTYKKTLGTSGTSYTLDFTLDEDSSYDFKLTVTDSLGNSIEQTALVSTKDVLMHFKANGDGLGIGKICEDPGLEVAMEATFYDTLTVADGASSLIIGSKTLLNYVYPVGSIYMSVSSTSPASLFGGTWTQLTDRFLVGAGSTYSVNATGGEATHTLTISEMPKHTHYTGLKEAKYEGTGYGLTQTSAFVDRVIVTGSSYSGNQGSGNAHNNLPPYLAVYMWKRTA